MLTLNFKPFPGLETNRLFLRQISLTDAKDLFLLRSDHRVMQYVDRPVAVSVDEIIKTIRSIIDAENNNEGITWAITIRGNAELIGTIGFWQIKHEHYRAEIGYMLHPDYQGQGIMHEALIKVVDYGFNIMKLHSIEANVNPGNAASIKLLEHNGFHKEAYFRENFYYNGKFLDSIIYSRINDL